MKNFANILHDLLNQRGINQKMLAEMSNTTEATISRYLTSDRTPRIALVISIAQALNVSTDYLLGLTPLQRKDTFTDEIMELIACYDRATESDRKVIWALLDKYQSSTTKIAAAGQDEWDSKDSVSRQKAVKNFDEK